MSTAQDFREMWGGRAQTGFAGSLEVYMALGFRVLGLRAVLKSSVWKNGPSVLLLLLLLPLLLLLLLLQID